MIRKSNTATERLGVNFIRGLFEQANCIYKEIDQQHDVGHDAFVLLVDGETVTSREIALQIKSGRSYCTPTRCSIPTDTKHLSFWREHPLNTYGIVYDPDENAAYWIDIKEEADVRDRNAPNVISFEKAEWNRIDEISFRKIFFQILMHRPLELSFEETRRWAFSEDYTLHNLGVGTMLYLYRNRRDAWDTFFQIFRERPRKHTSPELIWSLAHIPMHYDILPYFGTGKMDQEVRTYGRQQLEKFGRGEVIKLLEFVDEGGFERSSIGQSVGAVISVIDGYEGILGSIASDDSLAKEIRVPAQELRQEAIWYPIWYPIPPR